MHHRIRTRATPIVDDQHDLPGTLDDQYRTDSPENNSSNIEIITGNQEENNFLEKANRENNEAALAVLLLNVVAIIWGTQVSPSIDPYPQHPCS